MNSPFSTNADRRGELHTISVFGELDQATAPQLRETLTASMNDSQAPVLVDLSDCDFIDSTGLSLLVEAKRRLAEQRRRFGVCCPDADVRRLLELTGIDEAVGLFDTRDDAVASLASDPAA